MPRPTVTHSVAAAAGFAAGLGLASAPPVFHGPPADAPGVTCHVEKTGILTGQQVCTFGWVLPDGTVLTDKQAAERAEAPADGGLASGLASGAASGTAGAPDGGPSVSATAPTLRDQPDGGTLDLAP